MTRPGRLEGLAVLVLGGGSGIGRAATLAYVREGATVTVVDRSAAVAADLKESQPAMSVIVGDATDPCVVGDAIRSATAADGRLDQLTCCVGVFDHYASLRTLSVDELSTAAEEIWRVNVLGALLAVKLAHDSLRASRGSVTLTLSESAFGAAGGGVLYGSSKWALRGVVSHLSSDLAPHVRVNGVAPGGTSGTTLTGMGALGQSERDVGADAERDERIAAGSLLRVTSTPEDHAEAYVYLADPVAARVVTGTVMHTDGGRAVR